MNRTAWRPQRAPAPILLTRCVAPTEEERLAAFRARLGRFRAAETFRRARILAALDQRIDRRATARSTGNGKAGPIPTGNPEVPPSRARTTETERALPPFHGWRWALSLARALALPGA